MTLSPGTRFGPYEIQAEIGAGGPPPFSALKGTGHELRRGLAEAEETTTW
jgi:hypothetical protein